MAVGTTYPATITDPTGKVIWSGSIQFDDSSNQPAGSTSSVISGTAFSASGLTGSVSATRYVGGTADVAPTTGAHLVGDFVISATGRIWVCTVAATPGTWVEVGTVTCAPKASPTFTGTVTLPAALVASAIPTADPHVVGRVWANSGVLTVSAG